MGTKKNILSEKRCAQIEMSKLYHLISHAQEGAVPSIQMMELFRQIRNRSIAEWDAFWLEHTKVLVD